MAFQPIWDARLGEVYAYEALARGPNGEMAAEVLAQVRPETRYSFDQQCRVAAITQAVQAGILKTSARLAINFFPDVITDAFADSERTMQVAKETGFPPERLMFEFAEHDRIDASRMADTIAAHRKMHMQTVFDDFGSGDVGLALLSRFTPDAIKLDPALIRGLASSWSRRLLVEKMIEMTRRRAVRLIAEGVETRADYEKLLALGVRYFQGYFIAHPRVGVLENPRLRPAA
ncbi:EAL domain-containing protein [Sphingomonas suaedae]|uniref:EAL domain-containing protein n=2 Tax=Sphingomonas suaedae TaxID=2599297 RepID=A0A518RLC8_9SPHN|nr:EAL domain-containing protein [Sphingomonas suaedae]